jgi:L-aspartate oxidase
VHGANRLASNSLLETVVFAKRVVERSLDPARAPMPPSAGARRLAPETGANRFEPVLERQDDTFDPGTSAPTLAGLQELMWQKAGIVRDGGGLTVAAITLSSWQRAALPPVDRASTELANLVLAGRLVAESALLRQESRGAHYRTDFPQPSEAWRRHLVFSNRNQ